MIKNNYDKKIFQSYYITMRKIIAFVVLVTFSTTVLSSDCSRSLSTIPQGEKAPCDGWFVGEDKMQEIVRNRVDHDLTKKEVIQLKDLVEIKDQRIQNQTKQINELSSELTWQERKSTIKGAGYFLLGTLLTSIAAYAAIRSTK